MAEMRTTLRGFDRLDFLDSKGETCSLQKSSEATQDAIWLGLNIPKVKILARDAPDELKKPVGDPERENGWVDVKQPRKSFIGGRMHLMRDLVAELIPLLQKFVDEGEIR